MSSLTAGLCVFVAFYALLLLLLVAAVRCFPKSFLGVPAKAVLNWLPPFLGGKALRDWAANSAERLTRERLATPCSQETANRLIADLDEAAMQAMLPMAEPAERERIVACPETGQGRIGVTAPEALAIADFIRKNKSPAEQQGIYALAVENAKTIASGSAGHHDLAPSPCALQGKDHVCCVYAKRPLRCRPLLALSIAHGSGKPITAPLHDPTAAPEACGHEHNVAQGIELGVGRALTSAGLDASIYELNSALATALETPDAAARWAKGERLFRNPLR